MNNIVIRKYNPESDEDRLLEIIEREGQDWACYWENEHAASYKKTLQDSITYVATADDILCGYARSIHDYGFYIFVCDLLVTKPYRGQGIGMQLMEILPIDYPNHHIYVMSDVDEYYQKLGYHKEGSIFAVRK